MAFTFKLEHEDGTPVDPPTAHGGTELARGDTIPLGPAGRPLRVVEIRSGLDPDDCAVLVVAHLTLLQAG